MTLYRANPKDGAAWVTGASAGIGRELALLLAARGYKVYASARSADELDAMAAAAPGPGSVLALPLDVTDREACAAAVERIVAESGALAVAVFNAGNFYPVQGFKLSHEPFDKSLAINVTGVMNGMIPAIEVMKKAGRGQIAAVSSSAGYGGLPKSAAYGASKAGLINLCESLKFDLDRMNIRIQVVTPGFVDTPLTKKNDFPMPFLMPAGKAAKAFADGLERGGFDITFPKRFTFILKALNLLPYWLYFPVVARFTGMK